MRAHEFITEHQMDNENGWGAVADNRNVAYKGLRVSMRPSTFLKLAAPLGKEVSVQSIIKHVQDGGHLGTPFLLVTIPPEWEEGDLSNPAKITGHEGRNRMVALQHLEGSQHQEVHIFPRGGLRNRDFTPEWIARLNSQLFPEREDDPIQGPFWREVMKENMLDEEVISETTDESQIINIIAITIAKKLVDREMFGYNAGKMQFNAADLRLPKINDPVMAKLLDTLRFVVLSDEGDGRTLGEYMLGGDAIRLYWPTLKQKAGNNKDRLKVQIADTLSHELQHALDAFKGGKKPFSDMNKPMPNPNVGLPNKENFRVYLKQRHEVNARLQQALYDIHRSIRNPLAKETFNMKDLPQIIEWVFKRNELDNLYWKDERAYKRLITRTYKYFEAELNNPKVATPTPGLIQRAIAFITGNPTTEIK